MYIFIFIFIQFTAQSFIKFIPNYHVQTNNNLSNNDLIINDLKRQLNEEKIKNQNLINENNILKNNINNLKNNINNLNNQITNYINQIQLLQNQINNYQKNLNNNLNNINYINAESVRPGEKIFAVNFVSMGFQDIGHYSLVCKNTDLFVRLEEQLNNDYTQLKDKETYFMVNGRRIKRFKTLDENQIKRNDVINLFLIDDEN